MAACRFACTFALLGGAPVRAQAADRQVQSIVRSVGDPLALLGTDGGTKLADLVFAFDRSAMRHEERGFFRTAGGGARDYAGVFVSDDRDADVVFLHIHGGFFSLNDRYDVSAWILSVAQAAERPLVSTQYPLNRQSGWDAATVRAAVDGTLAAVHAVFPRAAVVVVGVSAGGTLALDLASRSNASAVAAVVVDSPNVCMPKLAADLASAETATCVTDPPFDPERADFVIAPLADMCFDDLAGRSEVPVLALFPECDVIIPQAQFDRYMARADDADYCVDRFGLHGNAASFMGRCLTRTVEWLCGRVPALCERLTRTRYARAHGTYVAREMLGYALQSTLPLRLTCRQLCATWAWDPLVWSALRCADHAEIAVPA
jgi:acetyl esterase/lipase